jgi:hypothetical protein
MGDVRGNDDDVALVEPTNDAAVHGGNSDFAGRRFLATVDGATGDEGRGAFQDVEDINVFGVNFDLAGRIAVKNVDAIVAFGISVVQRGALGECLRDLIAWEKDDSGGVGIGGGSSS